MERRLQRATLEAELYAAAIDAQKNERQRTIPTGMDSSSIFVYVLMSPFSILYGHRHGLR